ncbi:hypothetical protein PCANC_03760 [Puccinia coronata f. sp. avenae]|uniref:Uncharacterized protein n=1 Tax=Puccinia coronata f. sp. avenae TaxID=200324 RepID=A0A2N5VVA1_9BASI|nr:hypothetical protein PCANC_03760 [Puccinia coronata f. sp. avenae]
MSLRTRVPPHKNHALATPAPMPAPAAAISDGYLVQCQLVGSSAIPNSWYSASSPGGSPDKLVLHQLARRAPSKLVLHQLARRAPSKLVLHQLARRAPGKLVMHRLARRALGQLLQCQLAGSLAIPTSWYGASNGGSPNKLVLHQLARRAPDELVLHQLARRAPKELVLHQIARRAPGELILNQLPRRALGELAMYQLSGSWKAGIFLPACQEATSEVLPASWYGTSLPEGSPNELVLISAHQESPEYSAPACWGSAGERFCRVGIWRVPACFFTSNPETRTRTRHPLAGTCWKPTGTRRRVPGTHKRVPGTHKRVPDDIFI